MLKPSLPALNDIEGPPIPGNLPFIVDAHVHICPEGIFKAIWDWFDTHAWPIRYRFGSSEVLGYLLARGIDHVVAFQYAHKPGLSRGLNCYMAEICRKFPKDVTGMATVFPGETEAKGILEEGFDLGLSGVKLHCHVQCFDMNSKEMEVIYDVCASRKKPLVMHVSREPKSEAYLCDPYLLCSAGKLELVIRNYPELKVCVPHLGVDEFVEYKELIEKYENLWLDTAMVLTDYFPIKNKVELKDMRIDRVMYGTDFPNIPYAWDREVKQLLQLGLPERSLERVLGKNAVEFFDIKTGTHQHLATRRL